MGADRLEELLTRLHEKPAPDSGHRAALRAELVARFRQQRPAGTRPAVERASFLQAHPLFVPLTAALVLLVGLGAAAQVPADYAVEVGRLITVTADRPAADWPKPLELQPVLQQLGRTHEIQLKLRRAPEGGASLQIELWGSQIAADAVEQLRSAFPALREAQITSVPLEGTARGSLADKLGREVFHLRAGDPASIEAAKRELQARLRALGKDGNVDVQVEEAPGGRRKVTVKVEAVETAPAPEEQK